VTPHDGRARIPAGQERDANTQRVHDGGELRCGRAVQVDSTRTCLISPMFQRLKLRYDETLINFAYNFNVRRYDVDITKMDDKALGSTLNLSSTDAMMVEQCSSTPY